VGCYAQLKPEELAAVDGVDLVLGATEKFKITTISMIYQERFW
jgi:threonylcarbamoyladenosine tRNA methylthiotransferase MtaB